MARPAVHHRYRNTMASGVVWWATIGSYMIEILGVDGTHGLLYCWKGNPAHSPIWGLPVYFHDWSGYPSQAEVTWALNQAQAAIAQVH